MAKNVGVKIEKWVRHFFLQSPPNFFFIERQAISPPTKSSKTTLRSGAVQGVKLPFFPKKFIFWPENDIFSKKSFYSKLISDQNYIICTCQKIHFQNKIMRLQFSPDSTQLWQSMVAMVAMGCHLMCYLWRPGDQQVCRDNFIHVSWLESPYLGQRRTLQLKIKPVIRTAFKEND